MYTAYSPYKAQQINIKDIKLIPTKSSYDNMYRRSFTTNFDGETAGALAAVASKYKYGSSIPDQAVANVLNNVINFAPVLADNKPIDIPYGWNTQRMRFIMEVDSLHVSGSMATSFIQGYTEYYDPSITGKIDPNMLFYINSITNVITTIDPINGSVSVYPSSTINVLYNSNGVATYEEIVSESNSLIRPADMVSGLVLNNMFPDAVDNGYMNDLSGVLTSNTVTSKRSNNDTTKYLNSLLTQYKTAQVNTDITNNDIDILNNASVSLVDPDVTATPFIMALHVKTGEIAPSSFTLNLLASMDSNVNNKITLITSGEADYNVASMYNTIFDTNITANMFQPVPELLKANVIQASLLSYMLDNLMSKLVISFNNQTGINMAAPLFGNSLITNLSSEYLIRYMEKIRIQVENVLMPKISDGGYTILDIHVDADVLGDTTIAISLNNRAPMVYRFPTFSDSLYSPMVTSSMYKQLMSQDIANIFSTIHNI